MTDTIPPIRMDEFRTIWVYAMNMSDDDLNTIFSETFDEKKDYVIGPLPAALGLEGLDTDFVDLLTDEDLTALPLTKMLIDGHGMDDQSVMPDAEKLDTLRGGVLLVHAKAVGGSPPSQDPSGPMTFVGRYSEAMKMDATPMAPAQRMTPLPPENSVPEPVKKKPSDAAMGGRVATVALVLMGLLVWVMIKVAG